jgi:hypothetical protein
MPNQRAWYPLAEAACLFDCQPSLGTLWRWVTEGIAGGIRLKTVTSGGREGVTPDAALEFQQRVTVARDRRRRRPRLEATRRQQNAAHRQACKRLRAQGLPVSD